MVETGLNSEEVVAFINWHAMTSNITLEKTKVEL